MCAHMLCELIYTVDRNIISNITKKNHFFEKILNYDYSFIWINGFIKNIGQYIENWGIVTFLF